ncbi:MAG TPA: hypothetical protein VHU85_08235 [Acidimicrobiales bacterium]|jgi:hypothetical protein|nr:hypothetical protein [Acidimicrobiales bacterium]
MIEIRVMIANGGDTMGYRDRALDVIQRVNHLFLHELNLEMSVTNWDFRRDTPTVIPEGTMAYRSLSMVDRSEVVLAIFGPTVPKITRKEMWHAFERRRAGDAVDVWTFVDPRKLGKVHTDYFGKIKKEFHEEIVWTEYRNKSDFQGTMFTTMFRYLIGRGGAKFPGTAA